jgi:diguanylate cyclase (GGDEF)-like protein
MRTRRLAPVVCAVLVAAFLLELVARPGGAHLTRSIDDIAELVAAAVAAAAGWWRSRGLSGRARTSWALLAAGCFAWAAGEALWCYYELIAGVDTPFPSLADLGFLLFPVLALAGLLARPSAAFAGQGRLRVGLDALLVSTSLFVISWVTALGAVYRAGADSTFATVVSLAYPGTDIVLLAVAVVIIAFARVDSRAGLFSIVCGVACLTFGDSGFAYLTAKGSYGTVSLIDAGWVAGFLILAVAAIADTRAEETATLTVVPRVPLLLPYLPTTAAVAVVLFEAAGRRLDAVAAIGASGVAAAVVIRQMLVLLDNRALMSRITHQAFHDELTGLANRALFGDRLGHALDLHRRDLRNVTVLLIDLDDFKTVNDSLGHPVGDELLVRVSERLRAVVRTGDTVARLGGDEFAVLMEDGGAPVELAGRILAGLDQAVMLNGRAVLVTASVGIATLRPEDPTASSVDMLKRADMAMYAAKRAGKATVCSYTDELDDAETSQLDLRAAFAADLGAGAIDVAFQPIHLADGRLAGFEALARWTHDETAVSPATFLPMARRLGCIGALDRLVLSKAIVEATSWGDDLSLSVNLDGDTLADPTFAEFAVSLLAGRMSARRLAVEVLESGLIEHDESALETLRQLRAAGVRVAVDDFGAGYASLVRLQALEPDVVKIDRSLTATLTAQAPTPLLAGVAQLAHQIGAMVVAEGVETQVQLEAAVAAGCDAVQGFLLGRPTTPAGCREFLERATLRT